MGEKKREREREREREKREKRREKREERREKREERREKRGEKREERREERREKRHCMVCKEQGHNSLLHCSKLPEYIPRGNNVKLIPRELCKVCLSTAGDFKDCAHNFPKDYNNWICQQSKV